MSSDINAVERLMRPFVRHGVVTADGNIGGTTVISLWDPAVPEGMYEPDGFWNDSWLLILTGDMKDQRRRVTGWVQATGTLTVDPALVNPSVSLLSADVVATDVIIPVVDASVFSLGEAYIWDDAPNAEAVTITNVDTVLNQLTIAAPGLVNAYTVANNAAISMARRITDGTHFRLERVYHRPSTPLEKGRIFNTAVALATDFFAADLAPTHTPTTFRIYVALDTGGVLSVQRTSAAATVEEQLNSGAALIANCAYMFDILVHGNDTINLQTSGAAQILNCLVIEVPGVAS